MSGIFRLCAWWLAVWMAVFLVLPTTADAARQTKEIAFIGAPWKVILFVCSPSANGLDAMTLYGDGRVVVITGRPESEHEEYEIRLEKSAISRLLQIVSDHRLDEYDSDEIREVQLGRGLEPPPTTGNAETTVLLSLLAREKEAGSSHGTEKIIRLDAIEQTANNFPDLAEVQGVLRLKHELSGFLARARSAKASRPPKPDYSAVSYEFSRDPTKVIMLIRSRVGLTRRSTSMAVYGDGRAEMRVEVGNTMREIYNVQLTETERMSLLRTLVTSGSPEYDSTSIRARQIVRARGELWSGPEDAASVTIFFDMEWPGDEDHAIATHSRTIAMAAPDIAAIAFPGIPEITGIAQLQHRMLDFLDQARRQEGGGR